MKLVTSKSRESTWGSASKQTTEDIPEWIDERLQLDPNKEVQDRHIVQVFLNADRPYLSRRQVEGEIGLSDQGTQNRLDDLEERGILASEAAGGGRIYWIKSEKSAWPIPPDVDVEPVRDDLTVSELLDRQPIQFAMVGILLMISGALLTTLFTLALAYNVEVPLVQTQDLLLWAIAAVIVGISFCAGGVASWVTGMVRERVRKRA